MQLYATLCRGVMLVFMPKFYAGFMRLYAVFFMLPPYAAHSVIQPASQRASEPVSEPASQLFAGLCYGTILLYVVPPCLRR